MRTRGQVVDTSTREAQVPTAWTDHTQILDESDFAISVGIGYATVIKAEGRIGSPIDDWYLWCTPHTPSPGVFLATAPHPEGPWTPYSTTPVIATPPTGYDDLSPACVLWNPSTAQLMMWVGSKDAIPARQDTFLYLSTDGISWAIQNGGAAVLPASGNNTGPADGYEAVYTAVVRRNDRYFAAYQGVNKTSPDDVAHVCIAHSGDGITWTKMNTSAAFQYMAWANDSGDDIENCGSFRPSILKLDAGLFVPHAYVGNGDTIAERRCRRLLASGGFSASFDFGLGVGSAGQWDENRRGADDFVYHDGKFYCFYRGGPSGAGEGVGVASCTFDQSGFDTTWGKG